MDSWSTTVRLMMVMAAVAASSIIGRWLAETLQSLAAGGGLPSISWGAGLSGPKVSRTPFFAAAVTRRGAAKSFLRERAHAFLSATESLELARVAMADSPGHSRIEGTPPKASTAE